MLSYQILDISKQPICIYLVKQIYLCVHRLRVVLQLAFKDVCKWPISGLNEAILCCCRFDTRKTDSATPYISGRLYVAHYVTSYYCQFQNCGLLVCMIISSIKIA